MKCWVFYIIVPAVLLSLACGLGAAQNPPAYGGMPVWVKAGQQETADGDWVLWDEQDDTMQWGPANPVVGDAYAGGDILSSIVGIAKGLSTVYYHDPYIDEEVSMGTDVETWRPFKLTSSTLLPGTSVTVYVDLASHGTLQVLEQTTGKNSKAYASFGLELYDGSAQSLMGLSGSAEVLGNSAGSAGHPDGEWIGHFAPVADAFVIDYSKTVSFAGSVGETYWLYYGLSTSASASPGVIGLGWDGNKTFAQSDFGDTISYQLRSDADIGFDLVPEPTSLVVIGSGFVCLGAMFRRRRA